MMMYVCVIYSRRIAKMCISGSQPWHTKARKVEILIFALKILTQLSVYDTRAHIFNHVIMCTVVRRPLQIYN